MKINNNLIAGLNQPLKITARPFKLIADNLGISENYLLLTMRNLCKNGIIRRFGAVLNHNKIGLKANVLIAWRVQHRDIERAAKAFADIPEITHCYLRNTVRKWPFNLYTMLHITEKSCPNGTIKKISQKVKLNDYRVLFTLKEFKKTKTNLETIFKNL